MSDYKTLYTKYLKLISENKKLNLEYLKLINENAKLNLKLGRLQGIIEAKEELKESER